MFEHIMILIHGLTFLSHILHPIAWTWNTCRRFFLAIRNERHAARVLHDKVNHGVRDFVTRSQAIAWRSSSYEDRLMAIQGLADASMKRMCDELSLLMSRRIGKQVSISLGTITNTAKVVADPRFIRLVDDRCQAEAKPRNQVLRELALGAGGNGGEFVDDAETPKILVVTRIRSRTMPDDRERTSKPFWLLEKCPAHKHFHGKDGTRDNGVYCPDYDLNASDRERYEKRNGRHGESLFI